MNNSLAQKITLQSLLKFTFPTMVTVVVMSLYTIVDGIFVSRLIGTDAFSAVNIMYPLSSLMIGIGTMFGSGTTAVVSLKLGEGKQKEARENLTFHILSAIVLGIVLSAICFLNLKPIIYALGANEAVYADCHAYIFPLVFFFPANILQFQFQNLYVANGKPHIGLFVTVLGGLTNVVLDYLFIAKFGMGIAGAALATGIGCSIPAVYSLCYFTLQRKGALCFVRPKADWQSLFHAVTNGSSEMVTYLSTSVTTFLFNIIMMRLLGQDGVAAIAILLYLDFVLVAVSLGYAMGVAPLISYNYGCGNEEKLRTIFKWSVFFCLGVGLFMTGGTVLFAKQLAAVFTAEGTRVYELALMGLKIYAFSYLFKGYNVFASAMFTAFGNGKVSASLSFLRTFVFLAASLLGLSSLFGVDGVWFATPVAELLAVTMAVLFTNRYKREYRYLEAV